MNKYISKFKNSMTICLLSSLLLLTACERVAPPHTNLSENPQSSDSNLLGSEGTDDTSTTLDAIETTPEETTTKTTLEETTTTTTPEKTTSPEETTTVTTTEEGTTTTMEEVDPSTASPTDVYTDESIHKTSENKDKNGNLVDLIDIINPTTNEDKGNIDNPFQIGEMAIFDGYDTLFDPFRAEVTIQQVFRGPEALQMIKDASPLNPSPNANSEYLVAQVLVKITASQNAENVGISPYHFSMAREDGRMYGDVTLFRSVTPVLSPINVGESSIGYICFEVEKDDKNPYIVFLARAHGGIWFAGTSDQVSASADEADKNNREEAFTNNTTVESTTEYKSNVDDKSSDWED